jgi:hypothetical protein
MTEQGLPTSYEMEVPLEGRSCLDIARDLGLPLEMIEAVFINGKAHELATRCRPGDRVTFIPKGMPGPYRVLLGIRSVRNFTQ